MSVRSGKIPDLSRASMVNSYMAPNSFLTGVQCALALEEPGAEPKYAFLAEECRYENVVSREGAAEATIFGRAPGELVVLQTWEGPFAFRTRVSVAKRIDYRTVHRNPSLVNVDYVTPNYLTFDEAFDRVSGGQISPHDLYMHVSWGQGLNLFSRCNYTNYPNAELRPGQKYLQPISGQVCYYEGGDFYIAYVACSLRSDGFEHIEFCVRDSYNSVELAHGPGKLRRLFPIIKRLLPIYAHDYARSVPVDGRCRFYTYGA